MAEEQQQPPQANVVVQGQAQPQTMKEQAKTELVKLVGPAGAALLAAGGLFWNFAQPVVNKHVEVMDALKSNEPQQTRTLDKIAQTNGKLETVIEAIRDDQREIKTEIRNNGRKLEDIDRTLRTPHGAGPD